MFQPAMPLVTWLLRAFRFQKFLNFEFILKLVPIWITIFFSIINLMLKGNRSLDKNTLSISVQQTLSDDKLQEETWLNKNN